MIYTYITSLADLAHKVNLIEKEDKIYALNQVMHQLGLESLPEKSPHLKENISIPDLLDKIIVWAVDKGKIENILAAKEQLAANIMNCFVARPSVIQTQFYEKYSKSPVLATDYFYTLSKNSNYIQMNRIKKNIHFKANSPYGKLDITINLSKPEKDPLQIKREREIKQAHRYPACLLCVENEGYAGRMNHPARANHRVIPIELTGETWYLQYSPYVYYNEHSIVLCKEHRDMKIERKTFERLLAFLEKFPHYFIGSNADLPIVGGSILTHDHYQAGRYEFPMSNAEAIETVELKGYSDVNGSLLKWPLSAIRLSSKNREQLIAAADQILTAWKQYTDLEANVLAYTDDKVHTGATIHTPTAHNTITPIARMRDNLFELDLVLRNNRTNEEHPHGIFHPHADVHHIKKENIGLIEVMGLAVLPARLKDELEKLKKHLLGEPCHIPDYHSEWADQLLATYGIIQDENIAQDILQQELGKKFTHILEDAGVFKQTEEGRKAFRRFIQTLNN